MEQYFLSAITSWLKEDGFWQSLTMVAIVTTVIVTAVSIMVSKVVSMFKVLLTALEKINNQPPKDYKSQVYRDVDISLMLKTIKHDTNADRVAIYQYHNGDKSIANNPFLKFSCTHENLQKTIASVQTYMTEVPISVFGHWNKDIFDGNVVKMPAIEVMKEDSDMCTAWQILRTNHVSSIYLFPLKDPIGKTFGFGTIEYCSAMKTLDDKWVTWAEGQYRAVGALLSQTVLENMD